MSKWWAIIGTILADLIIRIFKKSGPEHLEGYSDGKTEEKLREKARKDGWDV